MSSLNVGAIDLLPMKRQDLERFQISSIGWLLPGIVLMGALFIAPVAYALYLGFTNVQLLGPHAQSYQFTGFANITRMIHDHVFWKSVGLTLIFVVLSGIVAQTVLGMALALLFQRALAAIRLSVGAIVILAWVLPEISAAFIWYAASQAHGTVSVLIGQPSNNLLASVPMLIVCVANAWRNTAFAMLVFSAGLKNVSGEVDEAAQLEGAGYWRRLVSITLPIMRSTIMTAILLMTLGTLGTFTLIYAMTQGGPGDATAILPVYMYIEAFQFNELGYGTIIALALIVIGAVFSLLYVRSEMGSKRKGGLA